jgi:hypothetical protein
LEAMAEISSERVIPGKSFLGEWDCSIPPTTPA